MNVEAVTLFNLKRYINLFPSGIAAVLYGGISSGDVIFGAESGGVGEGVILGVPDSKARDGITVLHLYVRPEFRCHGIGSLLVKEAVMAAKANGFRKLYFRYFRCRPESAGSRFINRLPGVDICMEAEFTLRGTARARQYLNGGELSGYVIKPLREMLAGADGCMLEEWRRREERSSNRLEGVDISDRSGWRGLMRDEVFLSPLTPEAGADGCVCMDSALGKPAGWIVWSEDKQAKRLYVRRAFVEPEYRGRNVMGILAVEAYKWLERNSGGEIFWKVKYWNQTFQRGTLRNLSRLGIAGYREDRLKIVLLD